MDLYPPSEWGVSTVNKHSVLDCVLPPYTAQNTKAQDPAEKTINKILDELDPELYQLSMKIHGVFKLIRLALVSLIPNLLDHPEIGFEERSVCFPVSKPVAGHL